ncbi:MAG: hypothetical protein ACRDQ6_18730 [Pseudonocardiaceae bacterium]
MIEKNAEVGGTWYENRYPGARVDTPSRADTHHGDGKHNRPRAAVGQCQRHQPHGHPGHA